MTDDCMFCAIARGETDSEIVYEDKRALAFEDINPQAPEHLLIIPREHITTVNELSEDQESLVGHLYTVAREVAEDRGFSESGYRLVMNCGEDAMQSVFHIHLHCLAGRSLDWPPG